MHRSVLRQASLCLALISPLFVSSCTSPTTQGSLPELTSENCPGCVHVNTKIWIFKPASSEGLEGVLQSLQHISPSQMNPDSRLRVIPSSHYDELPGVFRRKGKLDFIAESPAVTMPGQPLSASIGGRWGEFNAVLTPGPVFNKSSGMISFDISANFPAGGSSVPVNKVFNTGRVLFRNGSSLLLIQQINDEYIVWLVRADFHV